MKGPPRVHLQSGAERARPGAALQTCLQKGGFSEAGRAQAQEDPPRSAPSPRSGAETQKHTNSSANYRYGKCPLPGSLGPDPLSSQARAQVGGGLRYLHDCFCFVHRRGSELWATWKCTCSYLTGYLQTYIFERVSPFKEKLWSWLSTLYFIHPNSFLIFQRSPRA